MVPRPTRTGTKSRQKETDGFLLKGRTDYPARVYKPNHTYLTTLEFPVPLKRVPWVHPSEISQNWLYIIEPAVIGQFIQAHIRGLMLKLKLKLNVAAVRRHAQDSNGGVSEIIDSPAEAGKAMTLNPVRMEQVGRFNMPLQPNPA